MNDEDKDYHDDKMILLFMLAWILFGVPVIPVITTGILLFWVKYCVTR